MASDAPRRRAGIRARITVVAASVVALALLLGAVGFWFTLRAALYGQLDAAARQDAAAFAEQVDAGGPESLPDIDDDRFWQVIDRDSGAVVAASDAAEDFGALADREGSAPTVLRLDPDDPPFATAVERVGGDWIVVAGRSTEEVDATLVTVAILLAVSVPLVTGLVAITTWVAVGRSLAPVEHMRRQVEQLSASDLSARVDEPPTRDEIGRLAHTMNGMLGRLEESQAAQRRFVSDASHELKSPLASLRQYAEVARAHPDRIGAAELSDAVLDEGARLERLVQGMLVLTRADEGGLALSVADVDLDDLLLGEATRLRALGVVSVDAAGVRPARVRGDLALLRQVTRNLADNAARHARSRVTFGLTQTSDGALLTIEDDGAGIAEPDRERVFGRFVRLDDARARDGGGSGLGLAIVREIVRAHGGDVRMDAGPGGGARFTVTLPGGR
ncbi:Signal transduction histidine kinase [Microbacterium sp. cf046]|uniref:HAMP domain-containing sensor histidine kinase n=1 Tax=Microbacterium sp. cf046 TaxID=1761803 RepID=UPI0008F20734|nr:ATP-binding protein [Microbacterium sp. cf046]SFS15745.1 Signal transduction histidine kinase [Microbacterium sp. cf046]